MEKDIEKGKDGEKAPVMRDAEENDDKDVGPQQSCGDHNNVVLDTLPIDINDEKESSPLNNCDNGESNEYNSKFVCAICKLKFPSNKSRKSHINNVHAANRKLFRCLHCSKKYLEKRLVMEHHEAKHPEMPLKFDTVMKKNPSAINNEIGVKSGGDKSDKNAEELRTSGGGVRASSGRASSGNSSLKDTVASSGDAQTSEVTEKALVTDDETHAHKTNMENTSNTDDPMVCESTKQVPIAEKTEVLSKGDTSNATVKIRLEGIKTNSISFTTVNMPVDKALTLLNNKETQILKLGDGSSTSNQTIGPLKIAKIATGSNSSRSNCRRSSKDIIRSSRATQNIELMATDIIEDVIEDGVVYDHVIDPDHPDAVNDIVVDNDCNNVDRDNHDDDYANYDEELRRKNHIAKSDHDYAKPAEMDPQRDVKLDDAISSNLHRCRFCNQIFKQRNIRDRHIQRYHAAQRKHFSCPHCVKVLVSKEGMIKHLEERHPNAEKKYGVTIGANLATEKLAKRKFSCQQCDKSFTLKCNLLNHVRRNHGPTEKCYQCAYCPIKVLTKASIFYHLNEKHPDKKTDFEYTVSDAASIEKIEVVKDKMGKTSMEQEKGKENHDQQKDCVNQQQECDQEQAGLQQEQNDQQHEPDRQSERYNQHEGDLVEKEHDRNDILHFEAQDTPSAADATFRQPTARKSTTFVSKKNN